MKSSFTILVFLICSLCFSQKNIALEKALLKEFPFEGDLPSSLPVWSYNQLTKPKKLNLPTIKKLLPEYEIYEIMMDFFDDRHSELSECIVLFNENTDELIKLDPVWYSGSDEKIHPNFFGQKFGDKKELESFAKEFKIILFTGTSEKIKTTVTENGIIYETGNRIIQMLFEKMILKEVRHINPKTSEIEKILK